MVLIHALALKPSSAKGAKSMAFRLSVERVVSFGSYAAIEILALNAYDHKLLYTTAHILEPKLVLPCVKPRT